MKVTLSSQDPRITHAVFGEIKIHTKCEILLILMILSNHISTIYCFTIFMLNHNKMKIEFYRIFIVVLCAYLVNMQCITSTNLKDQPGYDTSYCCNIFTYIFSTCHSLEHQPEHSFPILIIRSTSLNPLQKHVQSLQKQYNKPRLLRHIKIFLLRISIPNLST